MSNVDVQRLFEVLERFPGLQRKDWGANQTGVDRGMEAVFIQRAPREVATYALSRLRFAAMPELLHRCVSVRTDAVEADALSSWGRKEGAGAGMMGKVISMETEPADRLAALGSLRFYYCRDTINPAVKDPWTDEGLSRVDGIQTNVFDRYPTKGPIWQGKFDTVKRLVRHIRNIDLTAISDAAVVLSLLSVKGIGDQTAAMVALFWLQRPVPIIDMYLTRLVDVHGLLVRPIELASDRVELRNDLLAGAQRIAVARPEWPVWRVLSSLYLWACEIGRCHCTCENSLDTSCPFSLAWSRSTAPECAGAGNVTPLL